MAGKKGVNPFAKGGAVGKGAKGDDSAMKGKGKGKGGKGGK